ncbi:hypothetical protein A4W75_05525 [Latilactobacillus curvatus]|nr:hypothetical protein A4W75_05525 [Latilactobacillus curvatus]
MTEVLTTLLQKCATEKAQDLYFRPLSTGWAIIERLATGLKPLQKVTLSEGNQWLNQMKYQGGWISVKLGVHRPAVQRSRWQAN